MQALHSHSSIAAPVSSICRPLPHTVHLDVLAVLMEVHTAQTQAFSATIASYNAPTSSASIACINRQR